MSANDSRDTGVTAIEAPRRNGELIFAEPWQSRAFGMVIALAETDVCKYEEFRQELIASIGRWDHEHADSPEAVYDYYTHWLGSFERLLAARGLLSEEEIRKRSSDLRTADHHDHQHD